jgi:hypothetical protein
VSFDLGARDQGEEGLGVKVGIRNEGLGIRDWLGIED